MAVHSKVRIHVHLIWGTYKHEHILNRDLRVKIYQHLVERGNDLKITIRKMNIQPEHVHCLINLPSNKTIAEVVQGLKGECSKWINDSDLIKGTFRWQRGYGAYSVSASQLEIVENYIKSQNGHHKQKTFQEEYKEWAIQYGMWDKDE